MKRRGRDGSMLGRRREMCRMLAVVLEEPASALSGGM